MTPEVTEEQLIDYLYGDLDDDQRETVEAYLDAHPEKREELEALGQTRGVLAQWDDEIPEREVVFVADRSRRLPPSVWRWASGVGVAAAAVLTVMFADFEVGVPYGRFHFIAGRRTSSADTLFAVSEQNPDRPLTVGEFVAVQNEYFELTRQLIEASEERQQRDLARVTGAFQEQRRRDMVLVGNRMDNIARTTGYGLEQTTVLLNHVTSMNERP